MTRVWFVILFGAATAISCNSPDVVPPTQLNLDRPVDISFACFGPVKDAALATIVSSAQPPRWCNAYSPVLAPAAPIARPPGLESLAEEPVYSWYGFILQPASGTVALSRFRAKPSDQFISGVSANPVADVQVIDADHGTPGKNAISVGENPVAIGTDASGCHEVIANAGSCDLSVLDINSAVAVDLQQGGTAVINRISVLIDATHPLRARAAAMVMQPSDPAADVTASCPVASAGAPTASGLAYIAYPGCHLVAGVNLQTGVIEHGIQFTGTTPTILTGAAISGLIASCVDECSGDTSADQMSLRPVTLDLKVDQRAGTRRLAIGADNSSTITVVDLDPAFLPAPAAPLQIALEDKDPAHRLGVTTVALTPQIAMGNAPGAAASPPSRRNSNLDSVPPANGVGEGQYVYAVATDGTVRVADVLNAKRECDTQVDMRFVRAIATDVAIATAPANLPKLQCFPIGDPAAPRRSGVKGPGIELPVDGAATSVAIIQGLDSPLTTNVADVDVNGKPVVDQNGNPVTHQVPRDPSPNMLIGYFAVITTSSGQSFIANVDDDDGPDLFDPANPQATAPVLIMAHQLRDSFGARGAVPDASVNRCIASDPPVSTLGGPRSSTAPTINVAQNTVGTDATLPSKAFELPNLLKEACSFTDPTTMATANLTVSELQIGASAKLRDEVYPDLRATITQNWSLSWEGPLSNDTPLTYVDGVQIRSGQMRIDGEGMHLIDQTRPFCEVGVEPFDIVQMRGCNPINGNTECPAGYSCFVHENNPVPGLGACMLTSEASRLSVACKNFLTSARRYTVARAESGELTLFPRKHVLPTTPIDGCTDDLQCASLAIYALKLRSNSALSALTGVNELIDKHTWQCVVDPLRAPLNGDPAAKRCVETCGTEDSCEVGSVCIGAPGTAGGTCMEGVFPSQSCVNGPQRFDLRASEAFTLIGINASTTKAASSGYVHTVVEKGGTGADRHACIKPASSGSADVSRIPLHAPPCAPATAIVNAATGQLTDGSFEANPCSTTVDQVDDAPNTTSDCKLDETTPTVPKLRTGVPAIKARTRSATLTLVDPYSPGDVSCVGDRMAALGKIPQLLPPPFDAANWFGFTYQLSFNQKAGYSPLTVAPVLVTPALPVKVVRGPSDSIWIMDDGDVLAVTVTQSSTKGQVYRIEMPTLGTVNVLQ